MSTPAEYVERINRINDRYLKPTSQRLTAVMMRDGKWGRDDIPKEVQREIGYAIHEINSATIDVYVLGKNFEEDMT